MSDKELLQMALDELWKSYNVEATRMDLLKAIKKLETALAQPVVAQCDGGTCGYCDNCPKQAQPVPLNDVLIDAKNNILWLMRRLPKAYEEPPHVLRCIKAIDDALISAQPVPLTREQIDAGVRMVVDCNKPSFKLGVMYAEEVHGIWSKS